MVFAAIYLLLWFLAYENAALAVCAAGWTIFAFDVILGFYVCIQNFLLDKENAAIEAIEALSEGDDETVVGFNEDEDIEEGRVGGGDADVVVTELFPVETAVEPNE